MNAAVYIRVSTEDQAVGFSLDVQQGQCVNFAENNGRPVVEVFCEPGVSAKTQQRPALQRCMAFCEARPDVDTLVVWKFDRLARNQADHHAMKARLAAVGTRILSATEPISTGPTGILQEGMAAMFAEYDNAVRAERTTSAMTAILSAGGWCHIAPIGYLNDRSTPRRPTLKIDPERAPLITRAFNVFASGLSQKSTRELIDREGLRSRSGKQITKQQLLKILRSPVYAGFVHGSLLTTRVKASWPALVDETTFDRVQALLDGGTQSGIRHVEESTEFPLRGYLFCAQCATPLTAAWSKGKNPERRYAYYRCYKCSAVNIPKARMENAFTELLSRQSWNPADIEMFKAHVKTRLTGVSEALQTNATRARARLARATNTRNRLVELLLSEKIDEDYYEIKRQDVERELQNARMAVADEEAKVTDLDAEIELFCQIVKSPLNTWNMLQSAHKRPFLRMFWQDGLTVGPGGILNTSKTKGGKDLRIPAAPVSKMASANGQITGQKTLQKT